MTPLNVFQFKTFQILFLTLRRVKNFSTISKFYIKSIQSFFFDVSKMSFCSRLLLHGEISSIFHSVLPFVSNKLKLKFHCIENYFNSDRLQCFTLSILRAKLRENIQSRNISKLLRKGFNDLDDRNQ